MGEFGRKVSSRVRKAYRLGHACGDDNARALITKMEWSEKPHPCKNRKDGPPKFKGKEPPDFKGIRALGRLLGGASTLVGDFGELAGFYVVDEATYGDVADVRVVLDAGDLPADILLDVLEGVEVRWRYCGDTGFLFEFVEELIVSESDHAAIGVIDDDKFLRA
jgi:hypothetical protein